MHRNGKEKRKEKVNVDREEHRSASRNGRASASSLSNPEGP